VLALLLLSELPFLYLEGVTILDDVATAFTQPYADAALDESLPPASLAMGGILGVLIIIAGMAALLRRRDARMLQPGSWTWRRTILTAAVAVVALRLFMRGWLLLFPGIAADLAAEMERPPAPGLLIVEMSRAIADIYGLPTLFLIIVVAAPICEEVMFRGVLLQGFSRYLRVGWANLLQASIFAGIHEAWGLFPFYLAMGLLAGSVARRSGSLLAPVLLHTGNNLLSFIALARWM
jgi:membrane protease YdiL (CAAX protease family)